MTLCKISITSLPIPETEKRITIVFLGNYESSFKIVLDTPIFGVILKPQDKKPKIEKKKNKKTPLLSTEF